MASVSDDFNRANAANLGGNWTKRRTGTAAQLGVTSNRCANNSGGDDDISSYSGTALGANQNAQLTPFGLSSSAVYVGPSIRCNGTGASFGCYQIVTDGASGSGHTEIAKWVSDSYSAISAIATTVVAGTDVIKIDITGTGGSSSLKAYKNGVQIGSTITGDTSHSSGEPGIDIYGAGTADDFSAADDAGGGGGGDPAATGYKSLLGVGVK
jgi:hypothetical protein